GIDPEPAPLLAPAPPQPSATPTPSPARTAVSPAISAPAPVTPKPLGHDVALEVWTGSGWATLMRSDDATLDPHTIAALRMAQAPQNAPASYALTFQVPEIPVSPWAGQAGRWMRLRLISGGYGTTQTVLVPQPSGGPASFDIVANVPPRLHAPRISFHRELP